MSFWSSSTSTSSSSFSPSPSPFFSSSASYVVCGLSAGVDERSGVAFGSGDLLGLGLSSLSSSEAFTFLVGTNILTTAFSFVLGSITVSSSNPSGNSSVGGVFSITTLFSTSTPFGIGYSFIFATN